MSASVSFHKPAELLNLNDRHHWAKRARLVKEWRSMTGWVAVGFPKSMRPCPARVMVDVQLPVRRLQRRDAHNYAPTVKAIIDGLVDAGVLRDDSTEFVITRDPTFVVGDQVTVTVTPESKDVSF